MSAGLVPPKVGGGCGAPEVQQSPNGSLINMSAELGHSENQSAQIASFFLVDYQLLLVQLPVDRKNRARAFMVEEGSDPDPDQKWRLRRRASIGHWSTRSHVITTGGGGSSGCAAGEAADAFRRPQVEALSASKFTFQGKTKEIF